MANGLTTKQHEFVSAYIGPARGNASAAARLAGYANPGTRGHELVKNSEIQAVIQAWRDEMKQSGVASLEYRVSRLDLLERKYFDLIEARKEAYKDVPSAIGGETGLVVGQLKKVTHVKASADDSEGPATWTEEQWEYVTDTAVTKEIRSIYDDTAKELGQRVDKVDLSGAIKREYVIVTDQPTLPVEDSA